MSKTNVIILAVIAVYIVVIFPKQSNAKSGKPSGGQLTEKTEKGTDSETVTATETYTLNRKRFTT